VRLVVDASTLIAELVRQRGRRLFALDELELLVSEYAWVETQRGLARRAEVLGSRIGTAATEKLMAKALAVVEANFAVVPANAYASHERVARLRIRDITDWPTVALALATESAILTSDPDFLGSGVPTWTYETLAAELERSDR